MESIDHPGHVMGRAEKEVLRRLEAYDKLGIFSLNHHILVPSNDYERGWKECLVEVDRILKDRSNPNPLGS